MKNTIITELSLDHTREAFLELQRNRIIDIKLWLGFDENKGEYNGVEISTYDDLEKKFFVKNSVFCETKYYEKVYKHLASFINMEQRWNVSVEGYNYIQSFNIYINFWYKIFMEKKINLLIFGTMPHGGFTYIAYLLAKSMNIEIITFFQMLYIDGKFLANKSIESLGKTEFPRQKRNEFVKLEKTYKKDIPYMKTIEPLLLTSHIAVGDLVKTALKMEWKPMIRRVKNNRKLFFSKIGEHLGYQFIERYLTKRFYLEKEKRKYDEFSSYERKYVYFPLHLQPEMTTDTLGYIYEDQILALERISMLIPENWIIYVKDNPKQTYYKRSIVFFKRLASIEKVRLVDDCVNTYDLMKNAQFVATITGTAGWEAITGGTNALVFGYAWYRDFPGVFEYTDKLRLEEIMNYKICHSDLEKKYNDFLSNLFDGVIANEDMEDADSQYDPVENNKKIYNAMKEIINQL